MIESSSIYIVITAYNESKYLGNFLTKLKQKTSQFIIVDDGSVDQTVATAKKFTPHFLVHPVNLGKGAAMKTGADFAFNYLDASAVIFMDGDDQHSVGDLDKFYELLKDKDDQLIFGIREFNQEMPFYRVLGNRFASFLVKMLFGQEIPDIPSGFKAMSKNIYHKLRWQSSDYGVELEIACKTAKLKLPFKTVNIKTIYHDLDRGMNLLEVIKMLYKILLWRINL